MNKLFLYSMFSLLLALPIQAITQNDTDTSPSQMCPIAIKAYDKYCSHNNTSYTCSKVEHFISEHCHYNINPQQICALIKLIDTKFCQAANIKPQEFCPIIQIIDNQFCQSDTKGIDHSLKFNPKELCPIFDFVNDKLCNSTNKFNNINPQEVCALINLIDNKLCT